MALTKHKTKPKVKVKPQQEAKAPTEAQAAKADLLVVAAKELRGRAPNDVWADRTDRPEPPDPPKPLSDAVLERKRLEKEARAIPDAPAREPNEPAPEVEAEPVRDRTPEEILNKEYRGAVRIVETKTERR